MQQQQQQPTPFVNPIMRALMQAQAAPPQNPPNVFGQNFSAGPPTGMTAQGTPNAPLRTIVPPAAPPPINWGTQPEWMKSLPAGLQMAMMTQNPAMRPPSVPMQPPQQQASTIPELQQRLAAYLGR